MFVMVCYDVPAHRTEVYKKLLKEYLIHEQASVFMGDIPESEVIRMLDRISREIKPGDNVLQLVSRNRHNVKVTRLSKEELGGQMRQQVDTWHGRNWSFV